MISVTMAYNTLTSNCAALIKTITDEAMVVSCCQLQAILIINNYY